MGLRSSEKPKFLHLTPTINNALTRGFSKGLKARNKRANLTTSTPSLATAGLIFIFPLTAKFITEEFTVDGVNIETEFIYRCQKRFEGNERAQLPSANTTEQPPVEPSPLITTMHKKTGTGPQPSTGFLIRIVALTKTYAA